MERACLRVGIALGASALALWLQRPAARNSDELAAERILELSRLSEGREYEKQFSAQTEAGGRRFPDFVVHLPGGRDIVIDSKMPLLAYLRVANAADDAACSTALAEHVTALR